MNHSWLKKAVSWTAASAILLVPGIVSASQQTPLKVVASFSIIADMVHQVGGEHVQVHSLIGPDADAHVFDPTPADAKALAQADVVVINGLGFEGWIDRLIKSSGFKGQLVIATKGVEPIKVGGQADGHGHSHGHSHGHGHGHDHGDEDPHAWQDLSNGAIYVKNIRDALMQARPNAAQAIESRANDYLIQIDELDAQTRQRLAEIPAAQRRVVSSHGAFDYFAQAYDVKFLSLQGLSTDREVSAGEMASLIRQINKEDIKALFVENMSDPRLLERISEQTGVRIGGELYSDALSPPGTPAGTYLGMFSHNVDLIWSTLMQ